MKLRSVSIEGFRSIRILEDLPVGRPTILAGHNDAGKTAIIDAILMLLGDYRPTKEDMTLLGEVGDPTARIEETSVIGVFDLSEPERALFGEGPIQLRRRTVGGDPAILQVRALAPTDSRLRDFDDLTVAGLRDRFTLLDLPHAELKFKADLLTRLHEVADASPQEAVWIKAPSALEKALPVPARFDASGPFDAEDAIKLALQTAFRAHLASEELSGDVRAIETKLEAMLVEDVAQMRDHIMDKVTDIGQIDIAPIVSLGGTSGLKATTIIVTNPNGGSVDLHRSGAGRARRIALAVWEYNSLLLQESGQDVVLLYDEPDTHLDYNHQRELMHLIRQQADLPNATVVVASHSMNMIDGVDIANVVHIRHEAGRTVIDRLVDDSQVGSHLGAIAASVGLRNTVLLHERLFVGVEGDSDARALPVLFKLAMNRQLEACGIALWPCRNNEGALRFAEFLVGHGRQVAFLVDADSRTKAKHIFSEAKLRSAGLDPEKHCLYVGDPEEIEDLFSDEVWARVANFNWQRDGEGEESDRWEASDFEGCRGGKFSEVVLQMIQRGSTAAPGGKPEMLTTLALSLSDPEDVPDQLVSRFGELISRAT